MKPLYNHIVAEGILNDIDVQIDKGNEDIIRVEIGSFLSDNYICNGEFTISDKPNKDGLYEVSSDSYVEVKNKNITSLTNGKFIFTKIDGSFHCDNCGKIEQLTGGPKKVRYVFNCTNCVSLKSLEGAPETVGGDFFCDYCTDLKSLKGCPKKIDGYFDCHTCTSLESLEGALKKIEGSFYCYNCTNLKSLKGAPKYVGRHFDCSGCNITSFKDAPKYVGGNFTCKHSNKFEDDINKYSKIAGEIYIYRK